MAEGSSQVRKHKCNNLQGNIQQQEQQTKLPFNATDCNINELRFAKFLVGQPLDPRQTFKNSNPFAAA